MILMIISKNLFYYASFFLNRRKLLDFVEAGGKDHYNEFANFFGFAKIR